MTLSKKDRLILSNQFKILQKLYPEEADYYASHRKAIEEGYTLQYDRLYEYFYEELSEEECREVLEILEMYSVLSSSYEKVEDKSDIKDTYLKFTGFDGNLETKLMAYTRYFIKHLGRYKELTYDQEFPDFNSHAPMLGKYRKMFEVWKACSDERNLSKDDIKRILDA